MPLIILSSSPGAEVPEMNRFPARRVHRLSLPILIAAAALGFAACDGSEPVPEEPAAPPIATRPAGSDDGDAPPAASPESLTEEGWGPLRIGMTRAEVVAAAGEDANPEAVGGPEPDVCDEFRPEQAPDGMLVMIEQGYLTRITMIRNPAVQTERGFGVGDPAAPIREAYGDSALVSPHKYSPAPAEYITVWRTPPPDPDARGLVYEIGSDGRVSHIHAGSASIQYVEGCL